MRPDRCSQLFAKYNFKFLILKDDLKKKQWEETKTDLERWKKRCLCRLYPSHPNSLYPLPQALLLRQRPMGAPARTPTASQPCPTASASPAFLAIGPKGTEGAAQFRGLGEMEEIPAATQRPETEPRSAHSAFPFPVSMGTRCSPFWDPPTTVQTLRGGPGVELSEFGTVATFGEHVSLNMKFYLLQFMKRDNKENGSMS